MQKLANLNSFGLVADRTTVCVMEAIRGKFAKSFRNARKVYSTNKKNWYFGNRSSKKWQELKTMD